LFLLPVPTTTLGAPSLTRSLRQGWDTTKAPVTIRKMPKGLVRYHQSGQFHFLTFSCYRRLPLLDSSASYSVFEYELERVRQRYGFVVAGYVLMPEHVHLLTNEPRISTLSVVLQVLKQQTSKKLKQPSPRQFWQTRYYDFNVYTADKTVEKLKYMHRNPVRRGLVEKPEDWPWSSFRHYATGQEGTVEIESGWTSYKREQKAKATS
jgi:putative transposase